MSASNNDDGDSNKRVREALSGVRTVDLGRTGLLSADQFDVDLINERFAYTIIGNRAVIIDELWKRLGRDATAVHDLIRFLSFDAFEKLLANQIYMVGEKRCSAAKLWMEHPRRREYQGVTFNPALAPCGADIGVYYNLWQGFSVEPDPYASCDIFLDHIRTNVANGNEAHAQYILSWFADIVQNPARRPGIALVLRGRQGTGKTVVGQHIGQLFEPNYVLVDDPRYITGNFNSHMASALLLQADEGFWAGDKQAEGRLKGLITSEKQLIEFKGKDSFSVKNFLRLLVTSNHGWVVPAGYEERRFAVFDVGEHCIQNHAYFANMAAEMEDGGYGALLHFLQTLNTHTVDLHQIPRTTALFQQKLATLPAEDSWWFNCLSRGWIVESSPEDEANEVNDTDETWPLKVEVQRAYRSYLNHCDETGPRHKKSSSQLGYDIRRLATGVQVKRATTGIPRPRYYVFPSLDTCRRLFEDMIGTAIDWETGEPLSTPSTDNEEART